MTAWLPVSLAFATGLVLVGRSEGAVERLEPSEATGAVPGWALSLTAGCAGAVWLGPAGGLLAALAGWLALRGQRRRRAAAEVRLERVRALEALAVLAGDLRSGRAPVDALAGAAGVAVAGSGRALAAAVAAARMGGDVPLALLAESSAVAEVLTGLAACWSVCVSMGSGLATGVERLEEGLRAGQAQRLALDAELAGPRATAGLLAVLPLGGIALAAGLGAHPLNVLFRTPAGLACLVLGCLLDGLGLLWTGRLVAGHR